MISLRWQKRILLLLKNDNIFHLKTKFKGSKGRNNSSHSWQLSEGGPIAFRDERYISKLEKIRRVLPRARRYALERIPTVEEIHETIEASDIREKALTLVFISSGIREGAIEHLKVNYYTQIKRDEKIVAGRLVIYSGDPEMYISFVTPEACHALDKYLDFRREHGEEIKQTSPLFRDKFDPIKGLYGHGKDNSKDVVIPMTAPAIRQYYNRLLFSIGIRNQRKKKT
jgi:hypothetical protein